MVDYVDVLGKLSNDYPYGYLNSGYLDRLLPWQTDYGTNLYYYWVLHYYEPTFQQVWRAEITNSLTVSKSNTIR